MIIDSSALLSILLAEPDAPDMARAINNDAIRIMSAATYLETSLVIETRRKKTGAESLDAIVLGFGIDIVPFTADQARIARHAFQRFGKGRHKAGLNFGDCISYALAKDAGEPLLFKGNDFVHTDIEPAAVSSTASC